MLENPSANFPGVMHGADYNPDQWPESVWDDDVRLMREANVNIATLPVFSWVALQPDEDTFTFDWLDRILNKLWDNGIYVCLATSTAAQPAWLSQKYPDVLPVGSDGVKRKHGNRQNVCPNSSNFRRLSSQLAGKFAERYKDFPGLLVWHVSNEYGTHCYCETCAAAFRVWLTNRYGTLAEVNRRWNTAFWGHTFTDFSQIETPTRFGERSMQSLLIDYDRFQSDAVLACYKGEFDALRSVTPSVPITTNLMGTFKPLDYHKWAAEMDIVSWDSYPRKNAPPSEIAFAHSLTRGLRNGQPFMLMEQTPSQQNWQAQNALKRPGLMRLWSYQAMAHGADTVMYFQWRRSIGAQEKYHGAIVEHEGTSKPRVFQEVAKLGAELKSLGTRTLGARVPAQAAILFDWENWWAIEYSSGPSVDLKYVEQCQAYFRALHGLNIPTDIVSPDADLSQYKLVIAPVLYMLKPGVAEKLEEFTKNGGTFVTTFFSGIVDENDLVTLGGYPGSLRQLLGVWAEEIDALMPGQTNSVVFDGATFSCRLLCDRVHAETAEVLATYGGDWYAGEPAVTVNSFGDGKAYYLATAMDDDGLRFLLSTLCAEQNLAPPLADLPDGVEVMPRVSPDGLTLLYVLNHADAAVEISLSDASYTDLLTGETLTNSFSLPGLGVRILSKL